MEKKINIILLTQHFPPENSGGVGRPLSLYKYFPKENINVIIVTTNAYGILEKEENIYRYESFCNWRNSSFFSFKRWCKYLSLILSKTISTYTDLYWYYSAKKGIGKYLINGGIDLMYATFPNIETLKLGYVLSKKYKIPLITEFRDGLTFETILESQNMFKTLQSEALERKILQTSYAVITIGNNLSNNFRIRYPNSEIHTVFNGYDKNDFIYEKKGYTNFINKQKIRIANFGSFDLTKKVNRDNLFIAIKTLQEQQIINNNNFELSLIGRYSEEEKNKILNYDVENSIIFKDLMPKKEGLAFVKSNFDYVLFYGSPNETTVISSKLLEYLYLGLPIIGICKGNEAADIIKQTGTGEVCDFDVDSIKNILQEALKREIVYAPKQNEIAKFDREYQAKQIADIIKNVLEK